MPSVKNPFFRWCSLCFFLPITLLTACSTSSSTPSSLVVQKPTPALSQTITGPTAPGRKNCQPASPMNTNAQGGAEVQGAATNAELWGLIMSTSGVPPLANSLVKIVWRMTGSGDFTIVALSPSGMELPPSQGPIKHLGSSWSRPGDEWGTGFIFPVAGCWDLHAIRGKAFGDVWLKVVD